MLMRMLYSVAKCVAKRNKNKKGNKINHKGILATKKVGVSKTKETYRRSWLGIPDKTNKK